jgi:hypothetical protein
VVQKTEKYLRRKKDLPAEIENLKLQLEADRMTGPRVTAQYKEAVSKNSSVSSPVESNYIKIETREERLRRREILLEILENTIKSFTSENIKSITLDTN